MDLTALSLSELASRLKEVSWKDMNKPTGTPMSDESRVLAAAIIAHPDCPRSLAALIAIEVEAPTYK